MGFCNDRSELIGRKGCHAEVEGGEGCPIFLLQFSHGPYYTFLSVYLEMHGYSRGQTGLLWSLGVVAEVVLFLVMHRLLARFTLRQILLASLALTALRWLLIGAWVDVLPLLIFAQCLHAASFASYHAAAVELVRTLFAGGNEGQGMALYSGISYGAGAASGALVSGLRVRETLLPLLLLPVLAPVLIGATRAFEAALDGAPADGWPWCGLLAVFAVLYSVAGAFAYGTLLEGS